MDSGWFTRGMCVEAWPLQASCALLISLPLFGRQLTLSVFPSVFLMIDWLIVVWGVVWSKQLWTKSLACMFGRPRCVFALLPTADYYTETWFGTLRHPLTRFHMWYGITRNNFWVHIWCQFFGPTSIVVNFCTNSPTCFGILPILTPNHVVVDSYVCIW